MRFTVEDKRLIHLLSIKSLKQSIQQEVSWHMKKYSWDKDTVNKINVRSLTLSIFAVVYTTVVDHYVNEGRCYKCSHFLQQYLKNRPPELCSLSGNILIEHFAPHFSLTIWRSILAYIILCLRRRDHLHVPFEARLVQYYLSTAGNSSICLVSTIPHHTSFLC